MKLQFLPLLIAAVELSLFASVSQAYFEYDDLSARDLGFDSVEDYAVRDYVEDRYTRQFNDFELSSIATRDLIAELESRLARRTDVATLKAELKKLTDIPQKKRTEADKKGIHDLRKQIKELSTKKGSASSGKGASGHSVNDNGDTEPQPFHNPMM
ncbi:hypothetical protein CVT24_005545 [Panaeolus cyanescens]|uniref:Uncharacterized protein n=1 Tax=Panaeolus cyanescens TaxID=181874 RepID=A0A409VQG6_9AGAR|nr:hypothetical protein CVT24_005545 [Panaeolus cyanescens]